VVVSGDGSDRRNRQELSKRSRHLGERGRKFVIDFTKTGYIDSSASASGVALEKIREQGGDCASATQ